MPEKPSTKLTAICKHCSKPFRHWPSSHRKFCSPTCYHTKPKIRVTTICEQCSKPFKHYPSWNAKFCSSNCDRAWKRHPDRIWKFVNKTKSCWLWTGGMGSGNHGIRSGPSGRTSAHRVVWEMLVGPIPPSMELCHNCPGGDNPLCVNPAHMFIGTRKQNAEDAVQKGQYLNGERCCSAKLKEEDVRVIRNLFGTITQRLIAKMFHVKETAISAIKHGKTWKHVT